MHSYRCFSSSAVECQARSGPDSQGSPPIAQWSSSSSAHFGALCKCRNASGFATRHYKAQSLRSVVVLKRFRCCVTSSAGPSHPEGANARTLARKLTLKDVVTVLPKLVGAAALCMAVLRLQGTRRLNSHSLQKHSSEDRICRPIESECMRASYHCKKSTAGFKSDDIACLNCRHPDGFTAIICMRCRLPCKASSKYSLTSPAPALHEGQQQCLRSRGSGAAGITQQSIPQVCLSILQHLHRPFCLSLPHIL